MGLIVKGDHVIFRMADGSSKRLSPSYGIIHDPDGAILPKCSVFIGPCRRTSQAIEHSSKSKAYFGKKYVARKAVIAKIPQSGWQEIGEVKEILYERRGKHAGRYYHPFKSFSPTLLKSGRFYRLELRNGCLLDDRGFVFP